MNIFTRLKENKNFTHLERSISDFILDDPMTFIKLDKNEIVQTCFVSLSTLYRFLDKIHVKNLNELKVLITSQYQEYEKEKEQIDYNYPFQPYSTHYQITGQMAELYNQTIASTRNLIDYDHLREIVSVIEKANHITMLPTSGNIHVAYNFQQNMIEIGKSVKIETVPYLQYMEASALKKGDLAIVISYANRGTAMLDIVKQLKKDGVDILLISSTLPTELFSYAIYHLYFCSYENTYDKIASFASRVSLQYLLDALFACIFNQNYSKNIQYRKDHKVTY